MYVHGKCKTFIFLDRFSNNRVSNFPKIRPAGAEVYDVERQTHKNEAKSSFSQFCERGQSGNFNTRMHIHTGYPYNSLTVGFATERHVQYKQHTVSIKLSVHREVLEAKFSHLTTTKTEFPK